jgi:DNA adenine methylase
MAWLFIVLQPFGSGLADHGLGHGTGGLPRLNLFTLQRLLEEAWMRLGQVMIECLDFRDLIPRYDRDYTLFFLDPPYWKINCYEHNFVEQDFVDLAEVLAGIKGRFLMTINDTPEVREIFARFSIEEIELKYSMSTKKESRSQVRTELLIGNE